MVKRRKHVHIVRKEERVLPTPETWAKLAPPVWQSWEPELVGAAKEIEAAIAIIAGPLQMRAADLGYVIRRTGDADLSPAQRKLLLRYKAWVSEMKARSSHVGYVVGVLGCDEPVAFQGYLMDALRLYVKVNGRRRRERKGLTPV
jgi:hypothetical protein